MKHGHLLNRVVVLGAGSLINKTLGEAVLERARLFEVENVYYEPTKAQSDTPSGYETATGFVAHSRIGGAPRDSWKGNSVPWFRGRSRW